MGKRARWISRLGADPFGDLILRTLAGEGIDVSQVMRDPEAPTGVFFREWRGYGEGHSYYYRRDSAASRLSPQDIRDSWLEGARHLHVTGITPAISIGAQEAVLVLMRQARQRGITISFDPNLRQKLWDGPVARETLMAMLPLCDIFLPGISEAEFLLGPRPEEEYGREFLRLGPTIVALKLGERGSCGFVRDQTIRAPAVPVAVPVDTTGAGDAFAGGFLSVLLDLPSATESADLRPALERGNLLGSLAVRHRFDWEGLPRLEELPAIGAAAAGARR
jgi:2-dehydro-3-deoxygluconokinase